MKQQIIFNVTRNARNGTVTAMEGFDHEFGAFRNLRDSKEFNEALKELESAFTALEKAEKNITKMMNSKNNY